MLALGKRKYPGCHDNQIIYLYYLLKENFKNQGAITEHVFKYFKENGKTRGIQADNVTDFTKLTA